MTEKKPSLHLDFRSGLPIYTQIVKQVQSQLVNKILQPGDQLPTVRALARELRVNFNTVARAYRILDREQIISTQQGRGSYIIEKPTPETSQRLRRESLQASTHRFIHEALRLGFSRREVGQMVRESLKLARSHVEGSRKEASGEQAE